MSNAIKAPALDIVAAVKDVTVIPEREQILSLVPAIRSERDNALTVEMSASEAAGQADYRAAALVVLAKRAGLTGLEIAESFGWLQASNAPTSESGRKVLGGRIVRAAGIVTDNGGSVRWSVAWSIVVGSKATDKVDSDKVEAAGIAASTYATVQGMVKPGGSVAAYLRTNPEAVTALIRDLPASLVSEAVKASGETREARPDSTPADRLESAISEARTVLARLVTLTSDPETGTTLSVTASRKVTDLPELLVKATAAVESLNGRKVRPMTEAERKADQRKADQAAKAATEAKAAKDQAAKA